MATRKKPQSAALVLEKPLEGSPDVSQQENLTAQVAELKTVLEKQPGQIPKEKTKKEHPGFIVQLKFETEGLAINCACRYKKITSKGLEETRHIIHKTTSGVLVTNKPTPYDYAWQDAMGKQYPESEIHHFEVTAKGETEVTPFERTETLQIIKLVDTTEIDGFLPESEYEFWSNDSVGALWQFARHLLDIDKAAVATFSFGKGFKEYWAILYPRKRDGEFGITMLLTMMRKKFNHMMSQNGADQKSQATGPRPTSVLEQI